MVIVTQNQFIIASKIFHIVLDENYEYHDIRTSSNRLRSVRELNYTIHIYYAAENASSNSPSLSSSSREETRECHVTLRGKVNAYKVYRDLIHQIREQNPDQLYLDKALENLLNQDMDIVAKEEQKDLIESKEIVRDRSPKKLRKSRKTKRVNKKVLRKSKAGNRSRSKRSWR